MLEVAEHEKIGETGNATDIALEEISLCSPFYVNINIKLNCIHPSS